MAQNETWLKHDLLDAVKVQYLDGNLFSMDNAGNLIGVTLTRDGEDYSGGGSVSANVIRSDGGTVAVSGALSGKTATVVLPQAAYAVPGVVSIVVKLTVSGQVTTIAALVANVYRSRTDTAVDPGTIIPSIQTLISQINTAVASIPADYSALWTKLAPAFSTDASYVAGQYVTYNSGLWRFNTSHSGSWSSSDVTAVNLGGEISDLKSAFYRIIEHSETVSLGNNTYMFDSYVPSGSVCTLKNKGKMMNVQLLDSNSNATLVWGDIATDGEITFIAPFNFYGIKSYVGGAGTWAFTIACDSVANLPKYTHEHIETSYNFTMDLNWEVGSIYKSNGGNFNSDYIIRTPERKAIYLEKDTVFYTENPLIGNIVAYRYNANGRSYPQQGYYEGNYLNLPGGYFYRFTAEASDTTTVITSENINTYSADIYLYGKSIGERIINEHNFGNEEETIKNRIVNVAEINIGSFEVGSIYGFNGGDFNPVSPPYAIRTKSSEKVWIETACYAITSNPLIETVYAFKWNKTTGNYEGRIGSGGKVVKLDPGYLYRFVCIEADDTVITTDNIQNYASGFHVVGDITGELFNYCFGNNGNFAVNASSLKTNVKIKQLGSISGYQSFLYYNNKYYSTNGNTLFVQDENFTLESTTSLDMGHGNAFHLGSNGIGYVSGWDDNKVYAVDLAEKTIVNTIALPTTGDTTAAIDDKNKIAYILQTNVRSTVTTYNLIAYDYDNEEIIYTKKFARDFGACQAVDFYEGKIYLAYGLGTSSVPTGIIVFDTNGTILTDFSLSAFQNAEPEGICLRRDTKELLVSFINMYVYSITN